MKNFIKIFFIAAVILFTFTAILNGQELKDNDFYKQAVDLFNNAKINYDKGDYDKGYELSEQARALLEKANQYNLIQIYILRIEALKKEAQAKIASAKDQGAEKKEDLAKKLAKAIELFNDGDKKYGEGNSKTEFKDKSELYKESMDFFTEADRWAKQVLLDMWPAQDMALAKDLLEQANNKHNSLLGDKILNPNDDKDKEISGLINKSKKSFDETHYKDSIDNSRSAIAIMDSMLNKDKEEAKNLLAQVQNKIKDAKNNADETKYSDKLREADNTYTDAKKFYEDDNYKSSIEKSKKALEILSTIEYALVFPRYYTVQLIPNKRDCLWRIAEKDFAYGDGFKWTLIYQQNKKKLRFPNNPNIIYPSVIIELPSIKGEIRKGMYDPKKKYPKFDITKDYSKQ